MRRIIALVVLSLVVTVAATGQLLPQRGSELCSQKRMRGSVAVDPQPLDGGPLHSFDILHYSLSIDIYRCFSSPFPSSFDGREVIRFQVDSTLNAISLNVVNTSLTVDSVSGAASGFTHLNDILTLTLDRTYSPGDTAEVRIAYRHNDVRDGAFYVNSDGMVFTDCEPQGARKWFPCWDNASDKATFELTAIAPSSVKLGSNGRLADSTSSNDTTIFHWVSRDPVATYLMVLTAKVGYNLDIVQWPRLSNPSETIPIRFYWNSGESLQNLQHIESIIVPMTTRYSQLFGEHPFEKNGFATLDNLFIWGGMENQTLTSLCPNCWGENLVSHEFAHQWFGDMITCGTWADIWLNEGFATYCEALWNETTGGYPSYKSAIVADANEYLYFNPGIPIYNASWAISPPNLNLLFNSATTYDKGACTLHMLRNILGDSVFFAALKTYATDPALKYKSAVTTDFIERVNQVSGQDLNWFFNQWVFQPNHPIYANTYAIYPSGTGSWAVRFTANQTQTNTVFFAMPLELSVSFAGGPDTLIRVMNNANNQVFTFQFQNQPLSLSFDPSNNIVLKNATTTLVSVPEMSEKPTIFELMQNYPNPFNPTTLIRYSIPVGTYGRTSLHVYDILGREVATLVDEVKQPGTYTVDFNGSLLASGLYVYRLTAGAHVQTRSMLLLK